MSAHQYGPHRKEDQPQTVTVFRSDHHGGDYQAPLSYDVRKCRYEVNQRAYRDALERELDRSVSS